MKTFLSVKYILFLFLLLTGRTHAQKFTINEAWTFHTEESGSSGIVSFPHTWNDRDVLDDQPGFFRGTGVYTKTTHVPAEYKNKSVYIYFEGANQVTDVYINRQHVGQHKGGYTRFSFDITSFLKFGESNEISIRVNNAHDVYIPPLSADFTFFGGVYRDVYLDVREKVHISPQDLASSGVYIRTPEVSRASAATEIETVLNNKTPVRQEVVIEHQLQGPDGKEASRKEITVLLEPHQAGKRVTSAHTIRDPQLWSIETPQLYRVKTTVKDKKTGRVWEEATNTFGLRWFRFDAAKGFFLNDKPVKLIGTNRHQDYKEKGNALEDAFHIRDIRLLKAMGGNFLRISHYPQDPLILEMCDQLGILASVEIPVVNAVTEAQAFLDNSVFMAEEMVKQNFNHPSLIMWSYMNEVMLRPPYKATEEAYLPYCKEVNRQARAIESKIRELDPSRYTMVAFHGSVKAYEDAGLFEVPMIIGWNLYQGWYSDKIEDFDRFLLNYREKYPEKPTIISEYGADVDSRIHSFDPERFDFSVEYGDLYHEHYLKSILKFDFIAAAALWNLNDFHSELRKNAVPHINSKGITETDRTPKNTYYLYQARLLKEPLVKIASGDWQNRAGKASSSGVCLQPVKIYSNRSPVAVFHNGKKLADLEMKDGVGTVEIPFTNGLNHIEARLEKENLTDVLRVNFTLYPAILFSDFREINVLMGTRRYFEEKETATIWIPEKPYETGSWGFTGGEALRPKTRFGALPAAEVNVLGTSLDPIFQTQRVGIETFKADVPPGKYAVYLYWADLSTPENEEALPYNLGNDTLREKTDEGIMDVSINQVKVLDGYSPAAEAGLHRAVIKKFYTDVSGEGLTIDFKSRKGNTILNAIKILKIN